MGEHIIDGEFQSDKYPDTPRGLIPLKPTDPMARDLLAIYASRRARQDPEFAGDLQEALRLQGYDPIQVINPDGSYRLTFQQRGEEE